MTSVARTEPTTSRDPIGPAAPAPRARGEQGVALVELALVLPLLLLLLLGTVTGGFVLNQKQQITYAAREGARYASTIAPNQAFTSGTWASNVRDLVVERSAGELTAAGVCVSLVQGNPGTVVAPASTYSTSGQPCIPNQAYPRTDHDSGLRVQVTGSRQGSIQLGVFGSREVTLSARATSKTEHPL